MIGVAGVFDKGANRSEPEDATIVKLHTKIRRFTMENDSLDQSAHGGDWLLSSEKNVLTQLTHARMDE